MLSFEKYASTGVFGFPETSHRMVPNHSDLRLWLYAVPVPPGAAPGRTFDGDRSFIDNYLSASLDLLIIVKRDEN